MSNTKRNLINRLKRTEGQLRGVQNMIQEDQELVNILTQLLAVRANVNRSMGIIVG